MSTPEFFAHFPYVNYWFADKTPILIRHILPRSVINSTVGNASGSFNEYRIVDGDTLESVSRNFYGDARWYWVIAIYNNIAEYESWPVTEEHLLANIAKSYPGKSVNDIAYYLDEVGNEVQWAFRDTSSNAQALLPVTIYQHESDINDKKRLIKIPTKRYLPIFEEMLTAVMVDA